MSKSEKQILINLAEELLRAWETEHEVYAQLVDAISPHVPRPSEPLYLQMREMAREIIARAKQ